MNGNGSYPIEPTQSGPLIRDSDELINAISSRRRRAVDLRLNQEEEDRLIGMIMNDVQTAVSYQSEFRLNHLEFMRNWRGIPEDKKEHPLGKLAANVKVPFTSTTVEQWKARFSKLILGETRIARFTSLNAALQQDLDDVTDWFDYELRQVVDIESNAEAILHYTLIDGVSTPIPYYEIVTETVFSCREFERSADSIGVQIEHNLLAKA